MFAGGAENIKDAQALEQSVARWMELKDSGASFEDIQRAEQEVAEALKQAPFELKAKFPFFQQLVKKFDAAQAFQQFRLPGSDRVVVDRRDEHSRGKAAEQARQASKEAAKREASGFSRDGMPDLRLKDGRLVEQKDKGQAPAADKPGAGLRAGLEQNLKEITGRITDAKVADYYRRGFDQLVFENFKKRAPMAAAGPGPARTAFRPAGGKFRGDFKPRPLPGSPEAVSTSVQSSALVRAGQAGPRQADQAVRAVKETELGRLLVESPEIALAEAESLAVLDLVDPSLDRLRHELLNLAASGSSLEKAGVQAHFTRKGMAELLARFAGP
ncbi:MAG TPA: hypothetical protein PLY45_02855, partial [bacterium]|nr:hypothetical protein [bacterium]